MYSVLALDSCAKPASESPRVLTPLSYQEIGRLVEVMLDLREGEPLPMGPGRINDFRPSSDKASLEILGTIAQRLEECRNRFQPKNRISVVELVAAAEREERQIPDREREAARSRKREIEKLLGIKRQKIGCLVARLRDSQVFRRSMCLLAFTLAAAVDEDWRLHQILNPYWRGW